MSKMQKSRGPEDFSSRDEALKVATLKSATDSLTVGDLQVMLSYFNPETKIVNLSWPYKDTSMHGQLAWHAYFNVLPTWHAYFNVLPSGILSIAHWIVEDSKPYPEIVSSHTYVKV